MKAKITVLIMFCVFTFTIKAQNVNIKEGAYLNSTDLRKNKPFIENQQYNIKKTLRKDIFTISVNGSKKLTRKFNYETWVLYYDSVMYINLNRLKLRLGFAKAIKFGRFCIFRGPIDFPSTIPLHLSVSDIVYYITAPKRIKKEIEMAIHFVDLKTGKLYDFSPYSIHLALKNDRALHLEYKKEENKDSTNLKIEYIERLNKKISIY